MLAFFSLSLSHFLSFSFPAAGCEHHPTALGWNGGEGETATTTTAICNPPSPFFLRHHHPRFRLCASSSSGTATPLKPRKHLGWQEEDGEERGGRQGGERREGGWDRLCIVWMRGRGERREGGRETETETERLSLLISTCSWRVSLSLFLSTPLSQRSKTARQTDGVNASPERRGEREKLFPPFWSRGEERV